MSEQPEFFSFIREEFIDEFVHPDDRPAVEEARQQRKLQGGCAVPERHAHGDDQDLVKLNGIGSLMSFGKN